MLVLPTCDVDIKIGDHIAQIMFSKPEEISFEEVSDFTDKTVRGIGGFGSTNKLWFFLAFFSKKMDQTLYDFSSFNTITEKENFVKELIKKQVDLSERLCDVYSGNEVFDTHYILLLNIQNSNFYRVLSSSLTTQVTIDQSANIFVQVLEEYVSIIITN